VDAVKIEHLILHLARDVSRTNMAVFFIPPLILARLRGECLDKHDIRFIYEHMHVYKRKKEKCFYFIF
jgi:hypothetical protein